MYAPTSLIMKSVISFILVATFIASLTLMYSPMVTSKATKETQDRIDQVCRAMEDYQFCNQTFHNHLPNPDTDKTGLTRIAIVESHHNATNTLEFIRARIPGEKNSDILNRLEVCENAYNIVQESFEQAFDAFNDGDYRGMESYERVTPRAIASCVTIFEVPPQTEDFLNERNREMRILITMAVVAGHFIVT